MSYGPSARQYHSDIVNELSKEIDDKNQHDKQNLVKKVPPSPHLLCIAYNKKIWALIDTGSQVSAISEEFYNEIKKSEKLLELPVANMVVSVAIGKKSTTIKKQTLLQIIIDNVTFEFIFLVVPFLANKMILGNDFHLKIGLIINYWCRNIQIKNRIVSPSSVLFELSGSERLIVTKEKNQTCIYIVKWNQEIKGNKNEKEISVIEIESQDFSDKDNIKENDKQYKMCGIDIIEEINNEVLEGIEMPNINDYMLEMDKLMLNACTVENSKELSLSEQFDSVAGNLTMIDENKRRSHRTKFDLLSVSPDFYD